LPPAQQNRVPAWEQKQTPWWERQGPPRWEQPKVPAWQTMNPARTLLEEQKEARQRAANRSPRHRNNGYLYVVPAYRYFPYSYFPSYGLPTVVESYETPSPPAEVASPIEPPPPPGPPPPPIGVLRLDVEPRDLIQIFVDGVYIGTPDDVGDDLGLAPGVRHIELRARGFKTLSFDADIVQDRSITYRGQLERDPEAPPPPVVIVKPPASGSRTMYVIPGCYLGNVAPTQASLRAGCDLSKLTTIEP
jgi:hypothetical protein